MPIDATCTGCRRRLSVRDEFEGRQVRCPGCGAMVLASPSPPVATHSPLPGFAGPLFAPPASGVPSGPGAPVPPEPPRHPWTDVFRSPSRFFADERERLTPERAARIGLPFLIVGALATAFQEFLLSRWLEPLLRDSLRGVPGAELLTEATTFPSILKDQILTELAQLAVFPLALHIAASMCGAKDMKKSYSIYLCSLAGRILDVVPLGCFVSWVYVLILNYLGLRHVHRLSEGRSVGAIVLAVVAGLFGVLILMSAITLARVIPAIRGG